MEQAKLRKIIDDKNERLEDNALRTAATIIDNIAFEQKNIANATERIIELRKELATLQIEQIDPATILG